MEETKEDKRRVTSAKNLAKARQAKLDKLKEKKENPEYHIEDESSESESEEDVIVVKPKKKAAPPPDDSYRNDLTEIKELLTALATKKTKPKPKRTKQVIQIVNPPPKKTQSEELETLKKKLLLNFN